MAYALLYVRDGRQCRSSPLKIIDSSLAGYRECISICYTQLASCNERKQDRCLRPRSHQSAHPGLCCATNVRCCISAANAIRRHQVHSDRRPTRCCTFSCLVAHSLFFVHPLRHEYVIYACSVVLFPSRYTTARPSSIFGSNNVTKLCGGELPINQYLCSSRESNAA